MSERRDATATLFDDVGAVGRDLARIDWADHPLGPPDTWPGSLRTILRALLTSRFSMWMAWGPELTFFCNDAYRRNTLGAKYPWALGRPAWEVWGEIWADIGPRIDSVLRDGVATWDETLFLVLERSGYREETYHTFSYSPLTDDAGSRTGMLCVVTEETERVLAERRMMNLRDVAAELTLTPTEQDVYHRTEVALARNRRDLPFVLLYLYDDELPLARRVAVTGLPPDDPCAPDVIADDTDGGWPSARARRGREEIELLDLATRFPHLAAAFGDRTPRSAMVLPLVGQTDARPTGFLVAGLNPQRPLDEGLRSYVRLVGNQVESAVASARALEAERRRAEALAELDRVKTQFFANISHEFRTPLTLLMGPLTELQRALPDGDAAIADNLAIMHRNALRLGKLVNAVLDFSRLQAGHEHARFEPLDLAVVTADLASMFSPAIEQAGLRLTVDCEPLDEPVNVDPSMWEKIVLNLLSNAFKFTLAGEITVRMRRVGDTAVLIVSDTGVGIPERELPHLFERFHRVERSRARSAEGTGIGLALVAELIDLHGGSVSVASVPEQGTTFTVEIPLGRAHLPHDPVSPTGGPLPRSTAPDAFLSEALRWIPDHAHGEVSPASPNAAAASADGATGEVLVVDDNADMRAYLARLLRARFSVRTAANGAEALTAIDERVPDLVLSDVMMPEVDGIELVRRIRAELGLTDLPVILLTAASGPDATTEGLDVGADDYLVKPFSADDLMGRVAARMAVGAERRQRQALTDLAVAVAACTDVGEVVREAHRFVAAHLGADISSLAVVDDGDVVRIEHSSRFAGGINERYRTGTTRSAGPLFAPLRTGQTVVLDDLAAVQAAFPESLSDFREGGMASAVSTPLVRANGEVMGTLASSWRAPRTFDPAEVTLHQRTAAALVDTLERLRAAAQEHRLLHQFQSQLLAIDQRSTLGALAARYQPAEAGLLVGGDWYDVVPFPDGAIGLSVGDVVGKGLPAATVMSQLRSALRLAAITAESPGRAVSMLDGYARQVPAALGASSTFLRIEPGGRLCWSTAGHPPLMVVVDDDVHMLTGGRRPVLGAADPGAVSEGCIDLTPGSLVLLYTDGLVERRSESIDTGLARLCDALAEHGHLSVGRLCEQLVRTMAPAGGFADDVAVLAFRTTGTTRDRFVEALPARPATLGPARRRFRAWLAQRGASGQEVDDLVLALTELLTNAIEHGSQEKGERIVTVEASVRAGTLSMAVSDSGRWHDDSTRSRHDERGRGFSILRRITDHVSVEPSQLGTTVVIERGAAW